MFKESLVVMELAHYYQRKCNNTPTIYPDINVTRRKDLIPQVTSPAVNVIRRKHPISPAVNVIRRKHPISPAGNVIRRKHPIPPAIVSPAGNGSKENPHQQETKRPRYGPLYPKKNLQ